MPNKDITAEEHVEIAGQIYNAFGYMPETMTPETSNIMDSSTEIDLYNAVYGDVSGDTRIMPSDASKLLAYYAEAQVNPEAQKDTSIELIGDMNSDGKITPSDASMILRQYADEQTK